MSILNVNDYRRSLQPSVGAKETMKIYLSGPMSGIPEYNAPAFAAYAAKYRALGHEVVSPPELDADAGDLVYESCIKRDMRVLVDGGVEALYMLPGWQQSKGANLEKLLAEATGIPCYDAETGLPVQEYVVERAVRPANKAKTNDEGKLPLAWLPWAAIEAIAEVQLFGHQKYKNFNNYRLGMEVSRNASCALRHIMEYLKGNTIDPESGLHHLGHALCRLAFILQNEAEGTAIDDRYRKEQ